MKPWQRLIWCIPPEQDSEFVWAMENVLEVSGTEPSDLLWLINILNGQPVP